jgi:hypothetical protein
VGKAITPAQALRDNHRSMLTMPEFLQHPSCTIQKSSLDDLRWLAQYHRNKLAEVETEIATRRPDDNG